MVCKVSSKGEENARRACRRRGRYAAVCKVSSKGECLASARVTAGATRRTPAPHTLLGNSSLSLPLLFGKINSPRLADDRDLDLSRVLKLRLDALGDVLRHPEALVVRDLLRVHDDAQLAAGLDRERALDALHAVRHLLELLEALDVGLEDLAAGARSRGRDGVGGVHEDRLDRARLVVAVVTFHAVNDGLR